MSKFYKIEIDVSSHVKKYIIYQLNNSKISIDFNKDVKLKKNHHIGLYILSLLRKQYKIQHNKEIKYNNKKINTKINILLAEQYEQDIDPRYNFLGINENGVKKLDKFIDGLFRQELFLFLNAYQMVGNRKIKEGILIFYKKYNLTDEDIPIETLLRAYRRFKNKDK